MVWQLFCLTTHYLNKRNFLFPIAQLSSTLVDVWSADPVLFSSPDGCFLLWFTPLSKNTQASPMDRKRHSDSSFRYTQKKNENVRFFCRNFTTFVELNWNISVFVLLVYLFVLYPGLLFDFHTPKVKKEHVWEKLVRMVHCWGTSHLRHSLLNKWRLLISINVISSTKEMNPITRKTERG